MEQIKFSKVRNVRTPEYGTPGSAGIDFFIPEDCSSNIYIPPHTDVLIPSGIKAKVPNDYALIAKNKSGIATSFGAMRRAGKEPKKTQPLASIIAGACVVDSDYQGEIHIHLINVGTTEVILEPGMKVIQFILVPIKQARLIEVPESKLFSEITERGTGAFGSTNK